MEVGILLPTVMISTRRYITIFPAFIGKISVAPGYSAVVNVNAGVIVVSIVNKWNITYFPAHALAAFNLG